MLIWLDGNTNRKGAPNENYGRELLELFTLGSATTPRTTSRRRRARSPAGTWHANGAEFFFNKNQHDYGPKTFLGQTGTLDGGDIIDNVVGRRGHGRTDLPRSCSPSSPTTTRSRRWSQPLADLYVKSNFEIKPVVKAILTSDAFYSDKAFTGHVKSPVEYVVGSVKQFGRRHPRAQPHSCPQTAGPGDLQPAECVRLARRTGLVGRGLGCRAVQHRRAAGRGG